MKNEKNCINGQWVKPKSGKYFKKCNPVDNKLIGHYPDSSREDVKVAVDVAKNNRRSWSSVPAPGRGEILFKMAELIERHKDDISRIIVSENGKPRKGSYAEINEAVAMARYYAGEGRRLHGQTTQSALPGKTAMSVRVPVGVVGTITSWNNPLAAFCWKVFPALICGNTVVHKPAEDTPETSAKCAELMKEAGSPDGVLNIVHGTEITGKALVEHPAVNILQKALPVLNSVCKDRVCKCIE